MIHSKGKKWLVIAAVATLLVGIAVAASVIYFDSRKLTDYEEQQQLQSKAKISLEEAKKIALEAVPGSVIYTALDDEGLSKIVYEVYIRTEHNVQEVEVNAKTGKIESIELAEDFPQTSINSGIQGNQGESDNPVVPPSSQDNPANTPNTSNPSTISQQEAEKIALDRVAGSVIESELDKDNGNFYYEVLIRTATDVQEVKVDGRTGQIISVEIEFDKLSRAQKLEILQSMAKISQQEAEKIALAQVSGNVISARLDEEDNRPVYEVIIQTATLHQEVTIDAVNGQVLEIDNL